MKYKLLRFIALSCIGLSILVSTSQVFAEDNDAMSGSDSVQNEEQSTDGETTSTGNIFKGEQSVALEGPIAGNVYAAGQTITLTGDVEKDVNIAGQSITISNAHIKGDLRAFGATVTIINSTFNDEVVIGSGTTTIDENSVIEGTLYIGTGDSILNGVVKEDLYIGTGSSRISTEVTGDAYIAGGAVTLVDGATFNNVHVVEETTLNKGDGVVINGEQIIIEKDKAHMFGEGAQSQTNRMLNLLFGFTSFLVLALVLTYYFPSATQTVSAQFKDHPWKSMFIGFGSIIFLTIVTIPFLISRIGMPLFTSLTIIAFGGLFLGRLFASLVIGMYVMKTSTRFVGKQLLLAQVAVGFLVLFILIQIPFLGFFVSSFVATVGLGALLLELKNFTDGSKQRIITQGESEFPQQ